MSLFQAPAQIQGISTLKDRTLKITAYISKELPAEDKTKLFDLEQLEGWLLFSPNIIQLKDVPLEDAKVDKIRKSSSERLYNVLFVEYSQSHKDTTGFNLWRESEMEKIIEDRKSRLAPNLNY